MHQADRPVRLDHDQRANMVFIDRLECSRRQHVLVYRSRAACHDIVNGKGRKIAAQIARNVAVRDDTGKFACIIGHNDAAETLLRQHLHRIRHGRARFHERQTVAAMHDIADMNKAGTERAAGMESLEIAWCEAARFEKRNGQRIANGKLHHRGSGGSKPMRAGFSRLRQEKHHIRRAAKG